MRYKFVEINELCDLLDEVEEISFTYDSCLENLWHDEPTGWYGIKIVEMFDCNRVIAGYYGGIDSASEGFNYKEEYEEAVRNVLETLKPYNGNITAVCVDMDEVEERRSKK